ncbi:MAG: hypothetical protein WCT50_02790 [Patescibacteria group bacterium]
MLTIEQQVFKQIEKAKNILLVFSMDWEGDSVAASLSLFTYLKNINKEVDITAVKPERIVANLSFLPGFREIKNNLDHLRRFIVSLDISKTKVSQIKYIVENDQLNFIVSPQDGWFEPQDVSSKAGEFKYDLIISVGVDDLESLGNIYDQNVEFFYKTPIINISCRAANEEFGQINLIDLNSVSTSEIIYNLLQTNTEKSITEDIATGLLGGIIIKTRNFRTGNLTPRTLMITSELISLGARREEIINRLYRSRQISDLKLWGKILSNLHLEDGDDLAWSWLSQTDIKDHEVEEEILKDMIDELMSNLPDTKIILILIEKDFGATKMFAFSLKNTNVLDLLKNYSPKGNIRSVVAEVNQDLNTAITEIVGDVKQKLDKLK